MSAIPVAAGFPASELAALKDAVDSLAGDETESTDKQVNYACVTLSMHGSASFWSILCPFSCRTMQLSHCWTKNWFSFACESPLSCKWQLKFAQLLRGKKHTQRLQVYTGDEGTRFYNGTVCGNRIDTPGGDYMHFDDWLRGTALFHAQWFYTMAVTVVGIELKSNTLGPALLKKFVSALAHAPRNCRCRVTYGHACQHASVFSICMIIQRLVIPIDYFDWLIRPVTVLNNHPRITLTKVEK